MLYRRVARPRYHRSGVGLSVVQPSFQLSTARTSGPLSRYMIVITRHTLSKMEARSLGSWEVTGTALRPQAEQETQLRRTPAEPELGDGRDGDEGDSSRGPSSIQDPGEVP